MKRKKELLAFIAQSQDEDLLRAIAVILGIDVAKWTTAESSSSLNFETEKDAPVITNFGEASSKVTDSKLDCL